MKQLFFKPEDRDSFASIVDSVFEQSDSSANIAIYEDRLAALW